MKVVRINGYHLSFKPPRPLGNGRMFIRKRDFLLVQLVCDNGVTGWGEAFSSPWAAGTLVRKLYAPLVLGRSPEQYGSLYTQLTGSLSYDRRGPAMMAISALDIAMCDAAARSRSVRIADLLGGAVREKAMAYASGPFMREGTGDPYGHFVQEAQALVEQGFRALKPRAGLDPVKDGAMTRALRDALGPDIGLMVDVNQSYTAGAGSRAARCMEGSDLLWIEEPVLPEDLRGYRAIAAASSTPLSGGEALGSLPAFREFLEASGAGLVQPDIAVCGGFSGFQRVAALCAAFDVPVMPHVFGTAVSFYASLQMASLLPERRGGGPAPYPYIEYDATGNPLLEMFGFPVDASGHVSLPDGPGLGIELDADQLAPWTVEHWSESL